MAQARLGVIGGSGLYQMEGITDVEEVTIRTPFGDPSDVITVGKLDGVPVAFLPRHGRGHRISPSEVPARANIYALKTLGVEWIISVTAVGSLKEELAPMHLVIPDQIIDRTRLRISTFFRDGIVAHVGFDQPFCPNLSDVLYNMAKEVGATVHRGGAYVAMEGPAFSTRAESELYRSWGASIIGMTALPEAKLAREAEICYGSIACVTDYDCWRPGHETVTIEMVIGCLLKNVATAKKIIAKTVKRLPNTRECACSEALRNAIITQRDLIPEHIKRDLAPIMGKYVK